ncbi:disulfide bond formation protein B [Sphingosinicella sp. BN140058]|uniref:disulfide bond formation protein B n=1 Tax=Sphingosinicella sp. BN140058 TaxID=1892855 RepID=UPI00197DD21D|nr:disulfide bond formation protein B [Sphingosinicella sp. BN140058]
MTNLVRAKLLAVLVPAALLAGAYGSEIWGGLYPCEMCWWQRYAHFAALALAVLAWAGGRLPDGGRALVGLAALAILTSGGIGAYHAGVEAGVFEGFTQCTSSGGGGSPADMLKSILEAPLIRCDQVQFEFLGISMAGWNAILSIGFGLVILWLSFTRARRSA